MQTQDLRITVPHIAQKQERVADDTFPPRFGFPTGIVVPEAPG
jgi:hypothetical protein